MADLLIDDHMPRIQFISYCISATGSAISMLVTVLLMLQISHYFYNKLKSNAPTKRFNQYIHYILLLYLLSNIVTLLCVGFIRNNIFTNVPSDKYPKIRCEIGFYGAYTFILINKFFIYSLFVYRIKILSKHSLAAYSSTVVQSLMGFIVFTLIAELTFLYIQPADHWILHSNSDNVVYCKRDDDYHPVALAGKAYVVLSDQLFCIIFIYMFVSKLRRLKQELMIAYLKDHSTECKEKMQSLSRAKSNSKSPDSKSLDLPNIDVHKSMDSKDLSTLSKNPFAVKVIASNYNDAENEVEKHTIGDILKLQELIVKQTILVSITMGSSLVFLVVSGIVPHILQQIWIDILLNSVCVWLMFACANRYWNKCVDLCCCCCYTKIAHYKDNKVNDPHA